MWLDLGKLLRPSYLFSLRPAPLADLTLYSLLVFFGILLAIGIALKIYIKFNKITGLTQKLLNKYAACCLILSLVGLVLIWLRQERVALLSLRLYLVLWGVALVVWLSLILKFQFKHIPAIKKNLASQQQYKQYLPKKRK